MQSNIIVLRNDHLLHFKKEIEVCEKLKIISPFITYDVVNYLLRKLDGKNINVLTRYNLRDFYQGVSDLTALELMIDAGVMIRGVKRLHSKLYIFDKNKVIISSANLTNGGMMSNLELGLLIKSQYIVSEAMDYFNLLWNKANNPLNTGMIEKWRKKISLLLGLKTDKLNNLGLTDEGEDCFNKSEVESDVIIKTKSLTIGSRDIFRIKYGKVKQKRYFLKIFGESKSRVEADYPIRSEIERAECHYAVCYPKNRRPRQVNDGDIIYMARMIKKPNDYAIFGKTIGLKHIDYLDDASIEEIDRALSSKMEHWKMRYPHYIRVKHAEFQEGILENCLYLLRDVTSKFKADSFIPTRKNLHKGKGNIEPKKSLAQKPAIELTEEAANWIEMKFQENKKRFGRVEQKFIDKLPMSYRENKMNSK